MKQPRVIFVAEDKANTTAINVSNSLQQQQIEQPRQQENNLDENQVFAGELEDCQEASNYDNALDSTYHSQHLEYLDMSQDNSFAAFEHNLTLNDSVQKQSQAPIQQSSEEVSAPTVMINTCEQRV